jgi:hypothetical protein
MAREAPASALKRLDLPAFGRPTIATVRPSRMIRPRAASASRVSIACRMPSSSRVVSPVEMK